MNFLASANDSTDIENIEPAFSGNAVTICLASSNEYVYFVSVVIASIIENSTANNNYDIIILNSEISQENINIVLQMAKNRNNFSIRFINISEFVEGKSFYTWAHFTKFTYYRLVIPCVLRNYTKVIYLDSDIIVNHDIAELYNIDIKDYLFAAARDTHVVSRCQREDDEFAAINQISYYKDTVGVEVPTNYVQCGVILMNIPAMNKYFPDGELIKLAAECTFKWLDQDLLNNKCYGKIMHLPNKWNVMVFNSPNNIDEQYLLEPLKSEYYNARNDPYIIHYIGRALPCYQPRGDMHWIYWEYARKSPFYEIILSIMSASIASYIFATNVVPKRPNKIKAWIKKHFVMPVINIILPNGSTSRKKLKAMYFKFRGWSY